MVLEKELLPYLTWLLGYPWTDARAFLDQRAARAFVITALVLAVLALVVGFLIALVRHGPLKAGDITYRVVANGFCGAVPHLAAPRVGARPAGDQGIDPPPRRRRAGRLSSSILLFAGWFLQDRLSASRASCSSASC